MGKISGMDSEANITGAPALNDEFELNSNTSSTNYIKVEFVTHKKKTPFVYIKIRKHPFYLFIFSYIKKKKKKKKKLT